MNSAFKLDQIKHAAKEALKTTPPPSRSWKQGVVLVMAFNGAVALMLAALMSRIDMPYASIWGLAGLVLAALLVSGIFSTIAPSVRPARLWVALMVLGVASFSLAVTPRFTDGKNLFAAGMPCLVSEFVLSVVPVTLCIWLLRQFAYHPVRTWLGVLASGLVGLLTLHWHCQVLTGEHVLWFHLLPWLAIGAMGVFIRSRMRSKTFVP